MTNNNTHTPQNNHTDGSGSPSPACSLSSLNERARKNQQEQFQQYNADPTDQEARDAYYYEEGRTRAYHEGSNALAVQKDIYEARIKHLENEMALASGVNADMNIRRHLAECERDELIEDKSMNRQRIEALKDYCRAVNPTWAWLMREVLEIVDPQSSENTDVEATPEYAPKINQEAGSASPPTDC